MSKNQITNQLKTSLLSFFSIKNQLVISRLNRYDFCNNMKTIIQKYERIITKFMKIKMIWLLYINSKDIKHGLKIKLSIDPGWIILV